MDRQCLEYIIHNNVLLTSIPAKIYINGDIICRFEPHDVDVNFDLVSPHLQNLLNINDSINIVLSEQLLMFAAIRNKANGMIAIIGPALSAPITLAVAKQIALSSGLSSDSIEHVKKYLEQIELISIENFVLHISTLNTSINGEIVSTECLLNDSEQRLVEKNNIYNNLIQLYEYDDQKKQFYSKNRFSYEYEDKLKFYVRHGMTDKLKPHLLGNYKPKQGIVAFDALRQYRDRCLSLVTIVSRAAIEGCADPATCLQLANLYCRKIEEYSDIPKINALMGTMLYDFTERTNLNINIQTDDPTIERVLKYIHKNLNKKIKVLEIAENIHINPGYLSVKFKKVTGHSVPDYINQKKIEEAKRLLKFTDKSISEISNFLAYSTQSYFHKQFKKITGKTPAEYRNQNQKNMK